MDGSLKRFTMINPADKTTAWTPVETGDPVREHHLAQAYLLCQRRQFDEAKRLLKMVLRGSPNDPDARYLLSRILSTEQADQFQDEKLRSWRFRLGLQTAWARFGVYITALALAGYGIWNVFYAVAEGMERGFAGSIHSMVYTGGKYRARYFDWTRPIYVDLIYGLALVAVGTGMMLFVYRLSRGAAMWEELGDMPGQSW